MKLFHVAFSGVLALVAVVAADEARAQQVQGVIVSGNQKQFVKTQEGDWQTAIAQPDGTTKSYTFVPSTKVQPTVEAAVAQVPGEAKWRYNFSVANGQTAKQQLAVLILNIANPVAVLSVPEGWVTESRPGDGFVIWRGPMVGDAPSGVAPGAALSGFVIEAPVLPGVGTVRSRGNTTGAVEVPPGLTDAQYRELMDISKQATVSSAVIAPMIGAGVGESELTPDVLLARIAGNYRPALLNARHPHATELAAAFAQAAESKTRDAGLQRLLELTRQPLTDRWHRELSQALAVCVTAVRDGLVPVKRSVAPGDLRP